MESTTTKNRRGYYTISATGILREEHAATASAALNKAVKMLTTHKELRKASILVDRGRGKTTGKVYTFGTVEASEDGFTFTPDSGAGVQVWDEDTKSFWLEQTPRIHAAYWVNNQHVATTDEELADRLKAKIRQAPESEKFTPDLIEETVRYAIIMHKRNRRLFYSVATGKF